MVKRASAVRRGFTLIEMLVVLGIIVVISAIVFSGESSFNRSFYITNTAYDVALTVRQAQTYGISSQTYGTTQNAGYGIYLSNASPASYIMFADVIGGGAPSNCDTGTAGTPTAKPGNCLYDGSGEKVQQFTLGNGFAISSFCVALAGSSPSCFTPGSNPSQTLSILFSRPNEDAVINTGSTGSLTQGTGACFAISDRDGDSRYIAVTQAGLISIASACDTGTVPVGGGAGSGGFDSDGGDEPPAPTPTCTLTANPTTVDPSTPTKLTLSSTNGVSAIVDNGVGSIPLNGSDSGILLSRSTTFTATVTGEGIDNTATCPARVTVGGSGGGGGHPPVSP